MLGEGFSLINVRRRDRMKRKRVFFSSVWLQATLFSRGMFSVGREVEERGRELMNEGGYKNRKLRGEGGSRQKGKRSKFIEAGLAVHTNVVIGWSVPT